MKASIVTIGDEILIGQIIDTNSAWLGRQLNDIGIEVSEILSVSDRREAILTGLERAMTDTELILITGGLGPTKDDITKKVLAEFLDDKLEFNDSNFESMKRLFDHRGITMSPAHKEQCYLPSSAKLIENKMGTAPGMLFEKDGKTIVSMPGVPYEMKYIMEHGVLPMYKDKSDVVILHETIRTVGRGESKISEEIEDIVDSFPAQMKIAYLPSLGQVRLRLTSIGNDHKKQQGDIDQMTSKIQNRLGTLVFGSGTTTLEEVLGAVASEHGVMISVAESCTGGHVAHKITSVSGSSRYFAGGIVAYSYELKEKILNVSTKTLNTYGAVSEETVQEMLVGLLNLTETDVGASISGIAGPTGGTPDKPVGTIWIAYGSKEDIKTHKLLLGKDRIKNIEYTTTVVLNLLRKFILENK